MRSIALTLLLLSACSEYRPAQYEPETVVLRGDFVPGGLEVSDKIRIGSDEQICVDAPANIGDALPRDGAPTLIVAEGNVTRRGRYGHLGMECTRRFRVSRLLEVRALTEAELNSVRIEEMARMRPDE